MTILFFVFMTMLSFCVESLADVNCVHQQGFQASEIDTNLVSILSRDDANELNARLSNGLSPNAEFGRLGFIAGELGAPLLEFAISFKATRCVRLLLDNGASVTRPDNSNEIAIQWAEEFGTPEIASMVERANTDTNLLEGLEITNAISRLCPPGSWVNPPTNVALKVIGEDEKSFGREMKTLTEGISDSDNFNFLSVSTNGPYPKFEYQIRSEGSLKTFGGMLSRHRGFYVITNTWVYDH